MAEQHGFERIVDHIENQSGGKSAGKETGVRMREHAERRGVDQRVELAAVHLFAQQGFGAAGTREGPDAVGIAADDRNFGSASHQRIRRAAGRAAITDD